MTNKEYGFLFIVVGTMIFLAFDIGSSKSTPKPDPGKSYSQRHEAMQKRFQGSSLEPTAKDAVWTSADMFKVGVIDDRTSRDGYAMYVCEVLNKNGFRGQDVGVQIIDIVQLNAKGKWIKLGEARCRQ